ADAGGTLAIAAVNGPRSVVLAGDEAAVLAAAARLAADGHKSRLLPVSHAFHSPLMDPMLDEFRAVVEGLTFAEPRIPLVSTVTGATATAEQVCSPEYWVRHVREAVRFDAGITALAAAGVTAFVELGPDGVLSAMAQENLGEGSGAMLLPALRRDRSEEQAITTLLGRLHVHGVPVAWKEFFAGTGATRVDLPTYAFQRQRYWPEPAVSTVDTGDSADAEFWTAVEAADFDALATTLAVDGDSLGAVLPALSEWRRRRREESVVDGWRYRVTWKPLTATAPAASGTWLVA
ncbi:acyltransferase domain-containing protein, partial [Amycolatopsis sp. SID8362]|uniref:acyltransferase domain-containing protein n=1 Tax=Amycolatopsis sp. SID8362 TaxID=2690346 RepID=UPI00137215B6